MYQKLFILFFLLLLSTATATSADDDKSYAFTTPEGLHVTYCYLSPGHDSYMMPYIIFDYEMTLNFIEGHSYDYSSVVRRIDTNAVTYQYNYSEVIEEDYYFSYSTNEHSIDGVSDIDYGYYYDIEYIFYDNQQQMISRSILNITCPSAHDAVGTVFIQNQFFDVTETIQPDLPTAPLILNNGAAVITTENTPQGLAFVLWDATQTGKTFRITPEQIGAVPALPESNTLIATSDDGYYRFYRLTTGELQLNIGPDFEGKEFVTIFNSGGQVVRTYTIDPQ